LPLLLIALSGVAITFQPAIVKARLGVAANTPWPEQAPAIAADVERIDALAGGPSSWWLIKRPTAHLPLYEIWLADGDRAYYRSGARTFEDRFAPPERFETWAYDLHTHLVAGEAGESVAGIAGLLALGLTASGIVVWWPARRLASVDRLKPWPTTRRQWLRSHALWGAILAAPIVLSVGTGVMLVYGGTAEVVLTTLLPGEAEPIDLPHVEADAEETDWQLVLAGAEDVFRTDRLVFIFPPDEEHGAVWFRTATAAEWHPNGKTQFAVDLRTGDLLGKERPDEIGLGRKILNGVYPVHAANGGASLLLLPSLAAGVGLAGIIALSVLAFLRRYFKTGTR
jgi:uncharacterized iron-regulated membrane protein